MVELVFKIMNTLTSINGQVNVIQGDIKKLLGEDCEVEKVLEEVLT